MDLAAWWRSRRWLALLELIDQLPSSSRFNEAVLNNPAQAELIINRPGSGAKWSPRVAEWDLHAIQMREVIHGLQSVRRAVILAAGGTPGSDEEFSAPVTAVDRALAIAERAAVDRMLTRWGFDPTDL